MKTTVNGKEIKLFGTADISLMFTTIIQDYLNLGFIFNYAESARGTQGEDMKADLTKDGGKTVYRVYVNKRYEGWENTCVYIIVEKFTNCNKNDTLWQGKGEKISEKKLWQIDDKRWNNVYVESKEDFEAIKQVQRNRRNERYEIERCREIKELPATANKIGLLLVRKIKGYKGTTLKQITKVEHRAGFGYDVYVCKNGRNEQHGFRTVKTR